MPSNVSEPILINCPSPYPPLPGSKYNWPSNSSLVLHPGLIIKLIALFSGANGFEETTIMIQDSSLA